MCMSLITSEPYNALKHSQLTLNAPRLDAYIYRIETNVCNAGLHKFMDFYYI